jgi:hypothetical protein
MIYNVFFVTKLKLRQYITFFFIALILLIFMTIYHCLSSPRWFTEFYLFNWFLDFLHKIDNSRFSIFGYYFAAPVWVKGLKLNTMLFVNIINIGQSFSSNLKNILVVNLDGALQSRILHLQLLWWLLRLLILPITQQGSGVEMDEDLLD